MCECAYVTCTHLKRLLVQFGKINCSAVHPALCCWFLAALADFFLLTLPSLQQYSYTVQAHNLMTEKLINRFKISEVFFAVLAWHQ